MGYREDSRRQLDLEQRRRTERHRRGHCECRADQGEADERTQAALSQPEHGLRPASKVHDKEDKDPQSQVVVTLDLRGVNDRKGWQQDGPVSIGLINELRFSENMPYPGAQ